MMTKLKPQEKPYEWVMVHENGTPDTHLFWVSNKHFSVHINDEVVIKATRELKHVRVIRRTHSKPLKGNPTWRIVATANQFPVAENEQVVTCDHVAPSPDSAMIIKNGITRARLELTKIEEKLNYG